MGSLLCIVYSVVKRIVLLGVGLRQCLDGSRLNADTVHEILVEQLETTLAANSHETVSSS